MQQPSFPIRKPARSRLPFEPHLDCQVLAGSDVEGSVVLDADAAPGAAGAEIDGVTEPTRDRRARPEATRGAVPLVGCAVCDGGRLGGVFAEVTDALVAAPYRRRVRLSELCVPASEVVGQPHRDARVVDLDRRFDVDPQARCPAVQHSVLSPPR